jgi:hypothetical protein
MALTRLKPTGVNTSATFSVANLTATSNVVSSNANLGNLATANYFHGVFDSTSNTQPNVTSVGTLSSLSVGGLTTVSQTTEKIASPVGSTYDFTTGAIFYTTSATVGANFTPNFTNLPTTDNRLVIVSIIINQGATPYLPTATTYIQIDGTNYTVKWAAGVVPTGRANSIQNITYSLMRVGATWYVSGRSTFFI